MSLQPYHQFAEEYFGIKEPLFVTGHYYHLQGASADSHTFIVYFNYSSKNIAWATGVDRCVYINVSNGVASVKDVAGTDGYNTPFYTWLTELVSSDFKIKQFPSATGMGDTLYQQFDTNGQSAES